MSYPVTRADVGYQRASSSVSAGHPRVEKGHRAEENHVSSTSSSCARRSEPHEQRSGSSASTRRAPQSAQCHAGIRCPHQIWREMHQSRMFSIHSKYVPSHMGGTSFVFPFTTAATAFLARG